jgi:hypothetical protein
MTQEQLEQEILEDEKFEGTKLEEPNYIEVVAKEL